MELNANALKDKFGNHPNYVNWKYIPNPKKPDKPDKPPYSPKTGDLAKVNDHTTWGTPQEALAGWKKYRMDGVGIVLTTEMGVVAFDFDNCIDPKTKAIEPSVFQIVKLLDSYTEITPSGKGLRVIVKGKLHTQKSGHVLKWVECYHHSRYITLTGHTIDGCPTTIESRQQVVDRLEKEIFSTNGHGSATAPKHDPQQSLPELAEVKQAIDFIIVENNRTGLIYNNYSSWLQLIFACASLGEKGRPLAVKLTVENSHYSDTAADVDRKFSQCVRDWGKCSSEPVTWKTIFAVAHANGWRGTQHTSSSTNVKEPQPRVEPSPWGEPIPFDSYDTLPSFPVEALPPTGKEMVLAVATVNQVDAGMAAGCYLSCLSICLAKKAEVNLQSHKEPLNIFTCAVNDSGERKTKTTTNLNFPLYDYQQYRQQELSDEIAKSICEYKIKEKTLAKLQDECSRPTTPHAEKTKLKEEAFRLACDLRTNPPLTEPKFLADDITGEKLADLMADNGERMGIISAEGGIFSILAGRYNEKTNFDIFLKGHAGDPWSCDRVGRPPRTMMSPALTMSLCVQPQVIKEIGAIKQFRGKGLLARFLYSLCRPKAGYRERQYETLSDDLLVQYSDHLFNLLKIPLPTEPYILSLTPPAQVLWDSFYNDIEQSMRPGGDLQYLKDWGSKLAGQVARIAGLLHLAVNGEAGLKKPISVGIVGNSCVIGAYYKEHAISAFGMMRENEKLEAAKGILSFLMSHRPTSFKCRDVLQIKSMFQTVESIMPGIEVLLERNYIKESDYRPQGATGRPQATTYVVNPKLYQEDNRES